MSDWLDPVAAALDAASVPSPIFFRDDDAGWDDRSLLALLDVFDAATVAVDVAAIPLALSRRAARALAARLDDGAIRVHQHGYAHVNHESEGRKCEFGPSRDVDQQTADICAGRARLEDLLTRSIDPVFTPPWNRCTHATADAAFAAGHSVLSRDHTAGRLDTPGLAEMRVTVDWSARRKGAPVSAAERGRSIAAGLSAGGPVGVMLHHAVLDADARSDVRRLLDLVATSPGATCATIVELAEHPTPAGRRDVQAGSEHLA